MGRGVLLVILVAAEACWTSSVGAQTAGTEAAEAAAAGGVQAAYGPVYDVVGLRWPYAGLYKRLPAQYNFGLGKRASKLYSFGLGKRAADYDDDEAEAEEELTLSDDALDSLMDADKRAKSYSFGLGKRARPYSFGLGKRAKSYSFGLGKRGARGADRKLYSFGLGKRLPAGEQRYAFGLGKRSEVDVDEQADGDEGWQPRDDVVGKREVTDQELKEVAAEHAGHADHPTSHPADGVHAATRRKRAAPMQYSFGLGKRYDEDNDVGEVYEVDDDELARVSRAGKQYGFGLGKRVAYRVYDAPSAKRGPRQYGFGLGRRSMQYNFGIGKRSSPVDPASHNATPSPAER